MRRDTQVVLVNDVKLIFVFAEKLAKRDLSSSSGANATGAGCKGHGCVYRVRGLTAAGLCDREIPKNDSHDRCSRSPVTFSFISAGLLRVDTFRLIGQ